VGAVLAATGCDKLTEMAKEKAMASVKSGVKDAIGEKVAETLVEKGVENALAKDGAKNVKVDLGKGSGSLSMTDKDGNQVSMAGGAGVQLAESDFGIPFYPGAKVDNTKSLKSTSGRSYQFSITLNSTDKLDAIANFYRDKLKAAAAGRRFTEMADGDKGLKLVVSDNGNNMLMVGIEAPEDGAAEIQLVAVGQKAK
jgi:hypothetical protein